MFTFFVKLYYNYNGDSMKDREQLILNIKAPEDMDKLSNAESIKYVNIDITNPNKKIIDYLLTNGQDLSFSYTIENRPGYIYIDYETFRKGQILIEEIINNIPDSLTSLEKCKYLYIKLGSFIGYDINCIEEKNEIPNLSTINTINNIWGSISNGKGTNKSITELFYYLCRLAQIDCKLIIINEFGYQKNIVSIDNTEIILDLTCDIPYIQSGYKTRFFGTYNDDEELDKKIGYLIDEYSEKKLEKAVKRLDYKDENFFYSLLLLTQDIVNVSNIQPIELGIIYNDIFNKYCPDQKININNLYINSEGKKEHFILITNEGKHYSFNYTKNSFVTISEKELSKNLEERKLGIYSEENLPLISTNVLKKA